jgi:hypothetical protein
VVEAARMPVEAEGGEVVVVVGVEEDSYEKVQV